MAQLNQEDKEYHLEWYVCGAPTTIHTPQTHKIDTTGLSICGRERFAMHASLAQSRGGVKRGIIPAHTYDEGYAQWLAQHSSSPQLVRLVYKV